ncbi:hypothetical protein G4B88_012881 [Cannabis sativa]|uniref:RING-type E3 ubiquitin transferase n=1 Tax=Cannabis sativa TaxID=3483 RepID=A0A7J6F5B8_CANSA|nr:hypothetical protein G4B88_012881 [Cannabis sativa]
MASQFYPDDTIPPFNATAVAVEKDNKNSKAAVRWAIDNLMITNPFIILIHVRHKNYQSTSSSNSSESGDSDARTIVDYINKNCITNLVAGASQRNALTRKFKSIDVPSSIVKSAPDFCSVFVISKGKIVTAKNAQRPALNTAAPPRQPSPQGLPPCVPNEHGEVDHGARAQHMKGGMNKMIPVRERTKSAPSLLLLDNMDLVNNCHRSSFGRDSNAEESDIQGGFGMFGSMDITGQSFEFSTAPSPPRLSASRLSAARELSQWKLEESKKFEEARNAEEAALAAAEMEKAKHPNMVLLLGACPEFGCLVYEYMNNGSLEDRLCQRGNTPPISWRKRFKIASEVATALLFLHQTKPEPLVHRDLKPGNILLDKNFVTKISDVGLARLVPPSVADQVTQYRMTSAAGTFCYIDPEYQQTGRLTTKSDIYSFGILLLQIITAKPPMGLAHHVSKAIEKGNFGDMLDPAITDWPIDETLAFANLALKCAELRKKDRPDLALDIVPQLKRLKDFGRTTTTTHPHNNTSNNSPTL